MDSILAVVVFIIGLVFGSFLNVCVSRIPRGLSIVAPRSCCPHCAHSIAARDNVPVISWILLSGKCRHCGAAISLRYPAVELLTAILFVVCYSSFGLGWVLLKAAILCFLIVGLIFMDAETGLLPALFTYPGITVGILFAWLVPVDSSGTQFLLRESGSQARFSLQAMSLLDAVGAALFGGGFFLIAWAAYYLVRKRDGLGFGDIALMAMVGTFLGLRLTVLVVFLAPVMGSLYALALIVPRPVSAESTDPISLLSREIPFGVFIGMSTLIALFFGQMIWSWYLGMFR